MQTAGRIYLAHSERMENLDKRFGVFLTFTSQRCKDCPLYCTRRLSSSQFCAFLFLGLISHAESSLLAQVWSECDTLIPGDALAPSPPI